MSTTTLASYLHIETRDASINRRDVRVEVGPTSVGNRISLVITSPGKPGVTVTVTLSGAERIALIEALGGRAYTMEASK